MSMRREVMQYLRLHKDRKNGGYHFVKVSAIAAHLGSCETGVTLVLEDLALDGLVTVNNDFSAWRAVPRHRDERGRMYPNIIY